MDSINSSGIKQNVLVFCRFYLVPDFRKNVAPLDGEFKFSFLTDGYSPGTEDTRKAYYASLKRGVLCDELTPEDEREVMTRCRLLRNLTPDRRRAMMHAIAVTLATNLDKVQPAAVLCHLVDDYVTHILFILAARRGIRTIGYFASYFPGYVQLTDNADGRALLIREPSDDEVQDVGRAVSNLVFRQNYGQNDSYTFGRHIYRVMRYMTKRIVFPIKSVIRRDPFNSHYLQTPFVAERRYISDYPFKSHFHNNWRQEIERLRTRRAGPVYYFPLGYVPESSTDYWIDNLSVIDYEKKVIEILQVLGRDGIVLVKEHMHMMGARSTHFYRAIKAIDGVVSVYPLEYSNNVLQESDAVVMGGGSIGIEATLRGKPVFTFCRAAFWFTPSRATWLDLDGVELWPEQIADLLRRFVPLSDTERANFIRDCLRTMVQRRTGGSRWPLIEPDDLRRALMQRVRQS